MKKITKAKYPEKTSINLVMREDDQGNNKLALIGFAIFLVALAIFVKFAVLNPMTKASAAEAKYNGIQNEIDTLNSSLEEYNDVSEKYSHYSNGYMNAEELLVTDRADALSLIDSCVLSRADVQSVNITGNTMTIVLSETDLSTVSAVVSALQADARTSYVTVSTAGSNSGTNSQLVTADIIIELANPTAATTDGTEAGGDAS